MDSKPNTEILEAALEYEELGYSVLPIIPGTKTPSIKWKEKQTKRAKPEEIKSWFKKRPDFNIAIVTGGISGIVSIDADGPNATEILEAESGIELPETISFNTGRVDSGKQHVFKYPEKSGLKNWTAFVSDGNGNQCDLRVDGGYFIAPPSVHQTGKHYEWVTDPRIEDPEPFPPQLIPFIKSQCEKSNGKAESKGLDPSSILTGAGSQQGKRNNDLYRYACRLRGKGICKDEARLLVQVAAANCDPPCEDPAEEAREKVDAAWKFEPNFFDGKTFLPSELAAYLNRGENILHDGSGFFKYYESGAWKQVHENELGREATALLAKAARQARIRDTLKLLEYQTFNEIEHETRLINLKNGMLDINKGVLLSHDKKYFSKVQIPIVFDPEADCPTFKKCLKDWFPTDHNKSKALQEFAGYCLYAKIFIHKCLFLLGDGANGKSLFIIILSKIIGFENIAAIELHQLGDKFLLGNLKDKLLNVSSEVDQSSKVCDTVFRQAVAGDILQADKKHKPPFVFRPIAKHIFSMNRAPNIPDSSFAFQRRLIVVKFNETFVGQNDDKRLEDKLTGELSGILNWALEGLKRVLKQEFITESPQMKQDKANFMKRANPVLSFVQSACNLEPDLRIEKAILYEAFRIFCGEEEISAMSIRDFYNQVLEDNPGIRELRPAGKERHFKGIGLKK